MSGLPNCGLGIIPLEKLEELGLESITDFYDTQAHRAAEAKICIDITVFSSGKHLALPTVSVLSKVTGGIIRRYDTVTVGQLVADLQKQLISVQGYHGALRIRTTSLLRVGKASGHFFPDPVQPNLYHIQGCTKHQAVAFDFEYTEQSGLKTSDKLPIVQLAFAYTCLEPYILGQENKQRLRVQRRVRIQTVQCKIASSPPQLYNGADDKVIIHILTNKILKVALEEGLKESRFILQDWLSILLERYNSTVSPRETNLDLTFSKHVKLRNLTRYMFALLKSPLFRTEDIDFDTWTAFHWYIGGCSSSVLSRILYSRLVGWLDLDTCSNEELPLNRVSVETSNSTIFVIDSYLQIVVYYTAKARINQIEFPPSESCKTIFQH
eukprot:TRINITY_DN7645_c0_g3_i5.p1 TRINITY_DN7645_c0_g3~~TRINITY_DN7645_c0_g3_i5.p1  ORF type:complete len:447 (+),score=60.02 TRINITY_DN7645_c0_g3_i5:199-1341(+)